MEKIPSDIMRVLWFSGTPSKFDVDNHQYHGGGWIGALESLVADNSDIELAVSFFYDKKRTKQKIGNVTYYPVRRYTGKEKPFRFVKNVLKGKLQDDFYISNLLDVVDDFKPDIIHVFGTEAVFGMIQKLTKVPLVIHIQGYINPCVEAFLIPGVSLQNILFSASFAKHLMGKSLYSLLMNFRLQAKREQLVLKNLKFAMGRTKWDREISQFYNSELEYYHVNEVLRDSFYIQQRTERGAVDKLIVVTTMSPLLFKGLDLVVKVSKLLRSIGFNHFEWRLFGISERDEVAQFIEKWGNVKLRDLGIVLEGIVNENELVSGLVEADIFVHCSYIDNSPNSVCEAQMLGLPVIATNSGGLSSIIEDGVDGFLVPANGVFELATHLRKARTDYNRYEQIGKNARRMAMQRHDKRNISESLFSVYQEITSKSST